MDKAAAALGEISKKPIMYVGEGANIMTYPVADYKYLNVAAFVRDNGEGPDIAKQTALGSKKDVLDAYSKFGPTVRALVELLPDELNRWALFDTLDHPLSTFAFHRIALAGDAAHGSTPHHGAGAGMGIEDALVLTNILERVSAAFKTSTSKVNKSKALIDAFEVYDSIRRERSQWLVASSRRQGQVHKWLVPNVGKDFDKLVKDAQERIYKIMYYDWKAMLYEANDELDRRLKA